MEPLIFFAVVVSIIALVGIMHLARKARLEKMTVVSANKEFPNNFHVLGVGYYHAASQRWFPYAWNEFREGKGYYWDYDWHETPDLRQVAKSIPPLQEIDLVNQAWRKADPDLAKRFWDNVEREGFGRAFRGTESR